MSAAREHLEHHPAHPHLLPRAIRPAVGAGRLQLVQHRRSPYETAVQRRPEDVHQRASDAPRLKGVRNLPAGAPTSMARLEQQACLRYVSSAARERFIDHLGE